MKTLAPKLVIALSSRALFQLDESHQVFEEEGVEAYRDHQLAMEDQVLQPGSAFELVRKLLRLNEGRSVNDPLVEIILLSRNSVDTGVRIFRALAHYGLQITRAVFSGGKSPYGYAKAFSADLFLSLNPFDVERALKAGCAAATIFPGSVDAADPNSLNIAFDGDAVLFSDEAERVFQHQGLAQFEASEQSLSSCPLGPGPFKGFLSALHRLQKETLPLSIRTALVTARSVPAHERVVRTLRQWEIRLDESFFLGGLSKSAFLEAFKADIFFDDQKKHCEGARKQVTAAHVPYGVLNEEER